MGLIISSMWEKIFGNVEMRILMVGLEVEFMVATTGMLMLVAPVEEQRRPTGSDHL